MVCRCRQRWWGLIGMRKAGNEEIPNISKCSAHPWGCRVSRLRWLARRMNCMAPANAIRASHGMLLSLYVSIRFQCIRASTHSPNWVNDTLGKCATHWVKQQHIHLCSPLQGVDNYPECVAQMWPAGAALHSRFVCSSSPPTSRAVDTPSVTQSSNILHYSLSYINFLTHFVLGNWQCNIYSLYK